MLEASESDDLKMVNLLLQNQMKKTIGVHLLVITWTI